VRNSKSASGEVMKDIDSSARQSMGATLCSTYVPEQHIRVRGSASRRCLPDHGGIKLEQFLSPFFDVVAAE
jgi:hypothetical protein